MLLAIPAVYMIVRSTVPLSVKILRILTVSFLFLAAAGPVLKIEVPGTDAVVVFDRSKSVSPEFLREQKETISIFMEEKGKHDRIGVLSFGRNVKVRKFLADSAVETSLSDYIDRDGTFLTESLRTALGMIPPERDGRIIVFSDGMYNGADPAPVTAECVERGIPVFYRYKGRGGIDPLSITDVEVPGSIESGAPFQINTFFRASGAGVCSYRLMRGGTVIAKGRSEYSAGSNILRFRDRLVYPGIETYRITVSVPDDPFPENNSAVGSIRVRGKRRICLVTPGGRRDHLSAALKAGGIEFDIVAPGAYELTPEFLDGYRAVILENVPAAKFNHHELEYLSAYVADEGGGLMLTGGRNSFGPGGYCRSPVEKVMPVSMEVRREHRKVGMALGLVLDRSGSMSMPVGGGKTKMDLANIAAASSVDMLTPIDTVGVVAVDSSAHIIVPFRRGNVTSDTAGDILDIESMGGGIFVYTGLKTMGAMMNGLRMANRHIILFADAADAEEPGSYRELIAGFRSSGITVSVVALGTEEDTDARFLKDIAGRGEGNIFFTTDPMKLPALFSMDTVSMVRENFIEEQLQGKILNDIYALGEISGSFPSVQGYNQTYLKEGGTVGVVGAGDEPVPLFAFRQYGTGRTAALSCEADGQTSGDFLTWKGYSSFFTTAARWLGGVEPPDTFKARVEQQGHTACVYLDIDPDKTGPDFGAAPELAVFTSGGDKPLKKAMEWCGPYTLKAEFTMEKEGIYRPAVLIGSSVIKVDPVNLRMSPEYEFLQGGSQGEEALKRIAENTGGSLLVQLSDIFRQPSRSSRGHRTVMLPFFIAAVLCVLAEIAERRFFILLRVLSRAGRAGRAVRTYAADRIRHMRSRRGRRGVRRAVPEDGQATGPETEEEHGTGGGESAGTEQTETKEKQEEKRKKIDEVFGRAKGEAKKRF